MNTTQQNETTTAKPDFGQGRYSPLMEECFHDCQTVFQLNAVDSEKLARQIASDVGAIMRNAPVKVKLGKLSEDGKLTLAEAAKVKGVTITNALFALKALHYAAEAGKHGFSWSTTKWTMTKQLQEAINAVVAP